MVKGSWKTALYKVWPIFLDFGYDCFVFSIFSTFKDFSNFNDSIICLKNGIKIIIEDKKAA